ncbi:MAG: VWA domain-containing protein, partial [Rhodococcus sp.]|nr:VWA domain-containing protein [Rhodococcus sp. (in: high G+C Gram-positive bacteria)]
SGIVYAGAALAAVVVVAGGAYVATSVIGGCSDPTEYSVAADPSIAPALTQVAVHTDPADVGCASFVVTERAPMQPPTPGDDGPDIWIPDSSLAVARASAAGTTYSVAVDSVASTPVVVVSRPGEAPDFDSWLDVVRVQGLELGDPQWDTVSAAPIAAALAEAESGRIESNAVLGAMVALAQSQAASGPSQISDASRAAVVGAAGGIAVAREQSVEQSKVLVESVPQSGTIFLDYPLVVTSTAEGVDDAARAFGDVLASTRGTEILADHGLRGGDRAPLPNGRGVGEVPVLLMGDTEKVTSTLANYSVLAKPSRALVVQDVSGSMNYAAGDRTRAELAAEAAETGTRLFPDTAELGLWFFSTAHSGSIDYTEIVPIRSLGATVGSATHREVVVDGLRTLPDSIGGGTALYDTVLAAFREVQRGYDPAFVNSVIVMTDGANEDYDSIGLDELLATLRAEQDPMRPVIVVTIGLTQDADALVLEQISAATGGTSYVARTPAEIPTVFADALESRTRAVR